MQHCCTMCKHTFQFHTTLKIVFSCPILGNPHVVCCYANNFMIYIVQHLSIYNLVNPNQRSWPAADSKRKVPHWQQIQGIFQHLVPQLSFPSSVLVDLNCIKWSSSQTQINNAIFIVQSRRKNQRKKDERQWTYITKNAYHKNQQIL